jgi:hypothetical protein
MSEPRWTLEVGTGFFGHLRLEKHLVKTAVDGWLALSASSLSPEVCGVVDLRFAESAGCGGGRGGPETGTLQGHTHTRATTRRRFCPRYMLEEMSLLPRSYPATPYNALSLLLSLRLRSPNCLALLLTLKLDRCGEPAFSCPYPSWPLSILRPFAVAVVLLFLDEEPELSSELLRAGSGSRPRCCGSALRRGRTRSM